MNYWIINHHSKGFKAHNDLIGTPAKYNKATKEFEHDQEGNLIPRDIKNRIHVGDK